MIPTGSGPVVGIVRDGVRSCLGIPYAAAPFGANRLRAPQPHPSWAEPLPADRFGPTAPKKAYVPGGDLPDVPEPVIPGEEILNLNVWSPESVDGPLPVLVWIHGGGFFGGCSANPWYDGTSFARHGLVVVSFNYRLGAEGFLEVAGAPANRAMLDWIAALEWVQENIAAFGGDPARVTVLGQSAGGMAVAALLGSPVAGKLFAQAIIASAVSRIGAQSVELARSTAERFTRILKVPADRDSIAKFSPDELLDAQEQLDRDLLASGSSQLLPWVPVIDDELIFGLPIDDARAGRGNAIPVLVGTTENEFRWRLYDADPHSDEARRAGQRRFADELFRIPTAEFVDARSADPLAAPTYRYEFRWLSQANPMIGSGHSLDIPFFFNNLSAPYVAPYAGEHAPQSLADEVHGSFARFALTGDPGWPAAAEGNGRSVRIFDDPSWTATGIDLPESTTHQEQQPCP